MQNAIIGVRGGGGRRFIYLGAGLAYMAPKFKLNPKNGQN